MKIESLTIQNFLTIRDQVALDLEDKGLVLVQGDNQDDSSAISNGAGKSTIGDAICWCLFGTTARGETGDDIINNKVNKECVVEIIVTDGVKRWYISRGRKHSHYKNNLHIVDLDTGYSLTAGTDKLTQEIVEKIIGCSYEVFRAAIYAAQESIPDLPGMTDKFLKQIVEEAAGITRLIRAHQEAKTHYGVTVAKFAEFIHQTTTLKKDIEVVKLQRQDYANKSDAWIKSKEEKIAEYKKAISVTSKEISDLNSLISFKTSLGLDEKTLIAKMVDLDDTLKQLTAETKAADAILKAAEIVESRVAATLKIEVTNAKKLIDDLKSINSKVGEPCGECGKPYCEEDLSDIAEIAKKKVSVAKNKIDELKAELESAKLAVKKARDALLFLTDTDTAIKENNAAKEKILKDFSEFKTLQQSLAICSTRLTASQLALKSETATENPYLALYDDANNKVTEWEADLITVDKTKDLFERNDLDRAKKAVQVFGAAGVRAHILDTVTPYLNERTAHYLATLSDGNINATWNTLTKSKSGELKEKFSIDVMNEKGASRFGGLSGGEKRKVRLSTAMALQDLVASRASNPISLWIADEIDDALDEAGLERLMIILEEKAREKGTVLMISHNSLSDWCKESITVVKKDDGSTIEGCLVI